MIKLLICTLAFSVVLVWVCLRRNTNPKITQQLSLFFSILCFFISTIMLIDFDRAGCGYQFVYHPKLYTFQEKFLITRFMPEFGVDGVSLCFLLLTTLLIPLCIMTSWGRLFKNPEVFCFLFLLLEFFLILVFTAVDIVSFFIFFESILIPMIFIIGAWGSRERRVKAVFWFILYTLFGSIFLLFVILVFHFDYGTTSFILLSKNHLGFEKQCILMVFIYVAFAVKIPILPFHIWLPEAHVEAPTAGSVILAGILLKLGGYGYIKIAIPVLSEASLFFGPLIETISLASVVYASLTTIRQLDFKRLIAYSSIAHMNLVILGIFSLNAQGMSGGIFLMLAHGLTSSGLFFCLGFLYDRYKTRLIFYYGGLKWGMPVFTNLLLVFCLGNIGLPLTCNFIGELLVFIGLIDNNLLVTFISISSVVFSVVYTMFFFSRVCFGNISTRFIVCFIDLSKREVAILSPLVVLTFTLGCLPFLVLDVISTSVHFYLESI